MTELWIVCGRQGNWSGSENSNILIRIAGAVNNRSFSGRLTNGLFRWRRGIFEARLFRKLTRSGGFLNGDGERIHGMILNRPDWCLSGQRMWGTPIPVFSCLDCRTPLADPKIIEHVALQVQEGGSDVWFSRTAEELLPPGTQCPACGGGALKRAGYFGCLV